MVGTAAMSIHMLCFHQTCHIWFDALSAPAETHPSFALLHEKLQSKNKSTGPNAGAWNLDPEQLGDKLFRLGTAQTILFGINVAYLSLGSSEKASSSTRVQKDCEEMVQESEEMIIERLKLWQKGREEMVQESEEMIIERLKLWQKRVVFEIYQPDRVILHPSLKEWVLYII